MKTLETVILILYNALNAVLGILWGIAEILRTIREWRDKDETK